MFPAPTGAQSHGSVSTLMRIRWRAREGDRTAMRRCDTENRDFADSEFRKEDHEGRTYYVHTVADQHTSTGIPWPITKGPDLPEAYDDPAIR